MDPGKVDREFFAEYIQGRVGAPRDDVVLGPTHGADFGVVSIGESVMALATDPLFVMRELGLERAAWFAFHIVLSDVSLSGLPPTHLSVDFNLPASTEPETFAEIWSVFDREAQDLGVNIVTGHTGVYAGSAFPTIGGATAFAIGDPEDLILPTAAEPGDRIIITKGPAIETTGVLAVIFEEALDLPQATIEAAKARFWDVSPVRDAAIAAAAGPVTAMHDATEGGIQNALNELAAASEVGLVVDSDLIPISEGVAEICSTFDIDPWPSSSEGTVIMTVEPDGAEGVVEALESEGIPAAVVGTVESGTGVTMDGRALEVPETDPFWGAYEWGKETLGSVE